MAFDIPTFSDSSSKCINIFETKSSRDLSNNYDIGTRSSYEGPKKTDGKFREKVQEPLTDTVVLPASLQQRAFQDRIIIFLEIQHTFLKDNISMEHTQGE